MIRVGLRVDVDTLRGARLGVPNLIGLLAEFNTRATFFFSVGPDNMGRHLWRMLRPAFLAKMFRTQAGRLYGWDILLRGTLGPGPVIGRRCRHSIRHTAEGGHEVGLHAWDHHFWQVRLGRLDEHAISAQVQRGYDLLEDILSRGPDCFAAPAWRVTPEALHALDRFPFRFQSDCRGHSIFWPVVDGRRLGHVQVPTTLPTYDELIGAECTPDRYNERLLDRIRPDRLNVLTIHAEVEGICCRALFQDFLDKAIRRHIVFESLGALLGTTGNIVQSRIRRGAVPGREGWLACQEEITHQFHPMQPKGRL
jgi:undecaprenyl phosphate-alpha-L-ara4FN deformylase